MTDERLTIDDEEKMSIVASKAAVPLCLIPRDPGGVPRRMEMVRAF